MKKLLGAIDGAFGVAMCLVFVIMFVFLACEGAQLWAIYAESNACYEEAAEGIRRSYDEAVQRAKETELEINKEDEAELNAIIAYKEAELEALIAANAPFLSEVRQSSTMLFVCAAIPFSLLLFVVVVTIRRMRKIVAVAAMGR